MVKGDFWCGRPRLVRCTRAVLQASAPAVGAKLGLFALDRLPSWTTRCGGASEPSAPPPRNVLGQNVTAAADVKTLLPDASFEHAGRVSHRPGTIGEQDWALSYYRAHRLHRSRTTRTRGDPQCARDPLSPICTKGAAHRHHAALPADARVWPRVTAVQPSRASARTSPASATASRARSSSHAVKMAHERRHRDRVQHPGGVRLRRRQLPGRPRPIVVDDGRS
jgi:hypothetical protein